MSYFDHEFWQVSLEADATRGDEIRYRYAVQAKDNTRILEGEKDRLIDMSHETLKEIDIIDTWNDEGAFENAFYTTPFTKILLADQVASIKTKTVKNSTHTFRVKAPLLQKNEVLYITGGGSVLGDWHAPDAKFLTISGNWWTVSLNILQENFPLHYKYGIYNIKSKEAVSVETGENRQLPGNAAHHSQTIVHDGFVRFANNTWKGAGLAIPVFSLKSKNSFGVGEFADLALMADWAKEAGIRLIQLLPINDTTATFTAADSYPYAAISAFALHPIYICLEKVAGKKQAGILKPLKKKKKQLNDLPELDYEEVMKVKLEALKEIFLAQKDDYLDNADFYQFFQKNRHWLVPYAAFCHLRDKYGTPDSSKWKMHAVYNEEAIDKFVAPRGRHYEDILFRYFIQFHLHLQLSDATDYAHKKGIVVKGDIPIGVYRYSCDTWMSPELYHMDLQAGAPPDDFAVKGQNWGFPTYNWPEMAKTNFDWWRRRFEQMSNYFDAFRIDHILGFFRIWSVPIEQVEGIMGHFEPAIPVYAKEFLERNIPFNVDRYTQPYITPEILADVFGDQAGEVQHEYLDQQEDGSPQLKLLFNTQQKIAAFFKDRPNDDNQRKIRTGLFDLVSNVVLFAVPGAGEARFHFRIDMQKTSSYANLDGQTKYQLQDLYINYFYRRQNDFWKKIALQKLPALKESTNMLICGEDLGMVPESVPEMMQQLGILSLEIQRMPKDPTREFFHPGDAPYLSVVMPSTHDMSTIRGWWQEDRARTYRFFNNELGQWGEAPETCEPWINKAIILQHLYSPAMWSIFQLQDLLGMNENLRKENVDEERINIPADPNHFWGYRLQFPLEQLLKEKDFTRMIRSAIEASGR